MRMRDTIRPFNAAVIVIAAGASVLAACSQQQTARQDAPAAATGERLPIAAQLIDDLRPVSGEYATRDQAEARARIPGTLVELRVKEGDTVKRGQVIGLVRDDRIGLQTTAFDAQTAAAAAEASRAQADLARTRDLYEHGVYAKARLEQVDAAAKAANAQLAAARAQRAASADLAGQGQVLAPASGTVLHATLPAGSVVMPGQSIATLTAGVPVIRLTLPEAQAHALAVGQAVEVTPSGAAVPRTAPVLQIYPAVTAGDITVDLAAPAETAGLIGSRVDVSVPVGRRSAILVPARFIVRRYGVDYVRVLKRDGSASDVVVQSGASGPRGVEVLSGLAVGDVALAPGSGR